MAPDAMRNNQAGPSCRRSVSINRGNICDSTTRSAICQVEAPSVCAFSNCSRGSSATRIVRSRIITGAAPIRISAIFDVSPRPSVMNRIGSSASGGAIETTATKALSSAPMIGNRPIATPATSATNVANPSAMTRRCRLENLSSQNT